MLPKRVLPRAVLAFLVLFSAALAGAQAYTKIVVFGDSLSDTGNDTAVSNAKYGAAAAVPSPTTGYTNGRFTDGTDTLPAAKAYFGVWLEQLAAMLPNKPTIVNSLSAGGTNYAYGFATTAAGQTTFTYGPGSSLSFQVNNMGAQASSYLATNPTIDNKTLFVVWGGANDLINATSSQDILAAAQREAGIVQALITAGATDFIVPNLPPLGLVPRFNSNAAASAAATQAAAGFDQALAAYLGGIPAANPTKTLHIYQLDTYTLFNSIVAAPASRGFANVTMSSSAALTGNTTVNPDTYLFWDDLHPTTHGHNLIALAAMTLLSPVATTTTLTSSNLNANQNANVTFTATVTSTGGIPTGTVTFSDGSTVLGSSAVSGATPTATYSTSALTPGTHTITATFTGVNGYMSSTSSVTEVVVAPSLSSSFASTTLNIKSGGSGTIVLTLNPVGGIAGTASFACGALPAHFTCSFSPASIALPGTNAPVTTTLTLGTNGVAALEMLQPSGHSARIVLAFAFPAFGLLGFRAMRRRGRSLRGALLTGMLLAICGAGAVGLTGCGSSNDVKAGAYPITAIATVNGVSATATVQVNVQ